MILRFRGKEGMFRVTVEPVQTFQEATQMLAAQLPGAGELRFASAPNKPTSGFDESWTKSIEDLGLKHGDVLFFDGAASGAGEAGSAGGSTSTSSASSTSSAGAAMHPVDADLSRDSGKIQRPRSKLCRHDDRGMCEYCKPLEPFDEQYRIDHAIKHLSLWAEIRKNQQGKAGGGRLEQPFYGVKPCKNHPPFPDGICSACQPQPISLSLQKFRVVDHVEFASPAIVENFVRYWRDTNTQRFGLMIGEYKRYEDAVPLGQKAVVHAIWEPEQSDALDGLAIEQPLSKPAQKAAAALGLEVVGVVWSDIVDSGKGDGSVQCKRHANSYFMSSQEVLFSARLQRQFPNIINGAPFSSKLVTCIVSGNQEGQIDVACYQTAVTAESLVESNLVEPSVNPAIVRVKPRTPTLYVPEVNYKQIDQYGNPVSHSAKPSFPTDFLLVSLSHGFQAGAENGADIATLVNKFAVENRPAVRTQTPSQLVEQLGLSGGFDSDSMADFHLLVYLFSLEVLNDQEEELVFKLLLLERENKNQDQVVAVATQLAYSDGISTLRAMV